MSEQAKRLDRLDDILGDYTPERTYLRDTWLALDSQKTIAPGERASFSNTSQLRISPYMLRVSYDLCRMFTLDDFKIGRDSLIAAVGQCPLERLANLRLVLPDIQVAESVTLTVTNLSAMHVRFMSVLMAQVVSIG